MSVPGRHSGRVGVFDSGVGGISVLQALVRELPHEDFLYYGDSAWAPYGEKPREQVLERSREITRGLVDAGCKAVVIACNTATSVAASTLRAEYADVPIVGVEPALKPAAIFAQHARVLVMATPITLRLEKYRDLAREWEGSCEVVAVPCPGLATRIEEGNLDAPDLSELLNVLVGEYRGKVDAVVLGCTHYPFIAGQIREALGDIPQFDGAQGTAKQLARVLGESGLANDGAHAGTVDFQSSKPGADEIALYERFFAR